jgi:hypothetical protein
MTNLLNFHEINTLTTPLPKFKVRSCGILRLIKSQFFCNIDENIPHNKQKLTLDIFRHYPCSARTTMLVIIVMGQIKLKVVHNHMASNNSS